MGEVLNAIPMERWGRDHWSTLAYIETRCVDFGGDMTVNRGLERMRCNHSLHPGLAGWAQPDGSESPTRLNDGTTVSNHDDWSCAEDMERDGLIEWLGTGIHPVFKLTDAGKAVAQQLRSHKAGGGTFSTFTPAPASPSREGSDA